MKLKERKRSRAWRKIGEEEEGGRKQKEQTEHRRTVRPGNMTGMGGIGEAESMGEHTKNKTKTCYMHIWRCQGETCSFLQLMC